MKKVNEVKSLLVYQTKSGALEIKSDFKKSTIWANQAQIADIFNVERSVVTKHVRNIFSDKELNKHLVCAKFAQTASDGKIYQVQHYNLDIILAIGYRTNSTRAIEFRKWATKTLRSFIIDGYAINKNRIAHNYQKFLETVEDIKNILPKDTNINTENVLELVKMFANTWLSLDAYDKETLVNKGMTKRKVMLTAEKLAEHLSILKQELISNKQATDLFGSEQRSGALAGIVGNVMQTFAGRELYESVEEKAAQLLYFIIKDHPFADGNKRSGAFSFVWFLRQARILHRVGITPLALTALAILVAESSPKERDKMIKLIVTLLK